MKNTLAADNGHKRPLRKLVAYESDVREGISATVIS